MAETHRQDIHDLIQTLLSEPQAFSFYQAVRILECSAPHRPKIGMSRDPAEDFVRFGQHVDLAYLGTDLRSVTLSEASGAPVFRMKSCFTGLTGSFGPMPSWLTEVLVHLANGTPDENLLVEGQGKNHRGKAVPIRSDGLAEFLDLFHHRMFGFLYRAWASGNMAVGFDRAGKQGGDNQAGGIPEFGRYVGSTFGVGTDGLFHHPVLPAFSRLGFAGHLSCQTRHAEGLESILNSYFAVPVKVDQFVGHWMEVPEESRCRLGESPETASLGDNAFLGGRIWNHQLKIRIRLGPMSLQEFRSFLPSARKYRELGAWVDFYTTRRFACDFQIILARDEVPSMVLGHQGELGRTSWLKSDAFDHDPGDLILPHDETIPN